MKITSLILASHDTLVGRGGIGDVGPDAVLDSASEEFAPELKGSRRCLATSC